MYIATSRGVHSVNQSELTKIFKTLTVKPIFFYNIMFKSFFLETQQRSEDFCTPLARSYAIEIKFGVKDFMAKIVFSLFYPNKFHTA